MAKLKEITVEMGVTIENKGVYYKPVAGIKLELDHEDTPDNRARIWAKAWEMVSEQVAKQIENI